MFHGVPNNITNELFSQIHIILKIIEGHLWLDHPKLGQVSGSIAVLCTKGWAECIDLTKGRGSQFSFELTTHRQMGRAPKKIFFKIYLSVFRTRSSAIERERGNAKHLTGSFGIAGSNDRGMEI